VKIVGQNQSVLDIAWPNFWNVLGIYSNWGENALYKETSLVKLFLDVTGTIPLGLD
jgi:hypothetical protein